ncbi:UPF0102 protein [Clostridia bacterium]|nr:UPF0102 protein [Clostridia bacterium]
MLSNNKKKGNYGETVAAGYLAEKGYVILERNYGGKGGEIDIIALSPDKYTVFIEVKYRKNLANGYPREAVTIAKRRAVIRAAKRYIGEKNVTGDMRFDVLEIYGTTELVVNHLISAFSEWR